MKFKILIGILLFCYVPLSYSAEHSLDLPKLKEQLLQQISFDIQVNRKAMEALPAFESPMVSLTIKDWRRICREQQAQLNRFQKFIQKTPPEELPQVLAEKFLDYQKSTKFYPPFEPYIFAMGESMIVPLAKEFDQADPYMKERILMVLGNTHSREALSVVRKALVDPEHRVVLSAQTALRLILQLESKPELEAMLMANENSWAVKHTLREIYLIGDKSWYEDFFKLARDQKLSLRDLAMIGDFSDCPQEVVGKNIDVLLKILDQQKQNPGEVRIAAQLLSKLDQQIYLKQLYPLLTDILHQRFRWGGKIEGFSSRPPPQSMIFYDQEADDLLKKIDSRLQAEDIQEWIARISPDLLTKFFLHDLLARKQGKVVDFQGESFSFKIEAIDQSNNLLASSLYTFKLGQEQNVPVSAVFPSFPTHHVKFKVSLDKSQWLFHLAPVLIDLKPYGAGFDIDVPLSGVNEIILNEAFRGNREKIRWRFEHMLY